uniref:Uncharacterized protein n=1 Tax=Timema poppense TaxID=170557 RepID=A0A7R9DTP6_TIMPO|nr:unnamed protein product [Timema poppensis]
MRLRQTDIKTRCLTLNHACALRSASFFSRTSGRWRSPIPTPWAPTPTRATSGSGMTMRTSSDSRRDT